MEKVLGSLAALLFGLIWCLPWLLTKQGRYKSWYLAPVLPPFMLAKALYGLPFTFAIFISVPLIALLPITPDSKLEVWGNISLGGGIIGCIVIIWTPRWMKPKWQLYLEDNYSRFEIQREFIPAWRDMPRKEWDKLMDSEKGIEELVCRARERVKN